MTAREALHIEALVARATQVQADRNMPVPVAPRAAHRVDRNTMDQEVLLMRVLVVPVIAALAVPVTPAQVAPERSALPSASEGPAQLNSSARERSHLEDTRFGPIRF